MNIIVQGFGRTLGDIITHGFGPVLKTSSIDSIVMKTIDRTIETKTIDRTIEMKTIDRTITI